jgi:mannose-6-phosphate isomerase
MPRIWGARSLAPIYPDKTDLPEPIGEAWLTGPLCEFTTGPFKGTVQQVWRQMPPAWRGSDFKNKKAHSDFPLLVKLLFPTDQLSIQVHPNDAYAKKNETSEAWGKTEMWHAISAEPGANLLLGLVPEVEQNEFKSAIDDGGLENFFERLPVTPGDTFYVPAGTPHTIGAGVVLCEVQQNSDLTYRLYDFKRVDAQGNPRELHVEKAMAVIDFEHRRGGKVSPLPLPSFDGVKKTLLAVCPYFASERWDVSAPLQSTSDFARFELLIILSGTGALDWRNDASTFHAGDCWFIPANLGAFCVQPNGQVSILRTYVPNLARLRTELSRQGIPDSALQTVFFA